MVAKLDAAQRRGSQLGVAGGPDRRQEQLLKSKEFTMILFIRAGVLSPQQRSDWTGNE